MQVQARCDHGRGKVQVTVDEARRQESLDELAARRRFNALVGPHMPALRARATQLCRSNYDADDVVQEALLRAFRTTSQLKDPTRVRAWLLTILTRAFLDGVRRQQRRPDSLQVVVDDVPEPAREEPSPWDDIGVEDLRAAIEQLPADVRDTYRMFALEGRDYASIAEAQRIAIATVGTRIFRARKQLRVLLVAAISPEAPR